METDKKNQVHVCPWQSSVSHLINKLIIETWESTSTFCLNGGTWFPFTMKLSYLKTLILMREKMVPRLCMTLYNGLKFSTSSGLILLTELLPIVSFGKLFKGWFSVTFLNHLLLHLFFPCAANLQKLPVLVEDKVDHLEPGY